MSDRVTWDALFVLNQCSPKNLVREKVSQIRARRVLLVGSHHFFKSERQVWKRLLNCKEIEFVSFADHLSDEVMANIDSGTSNILRESRGAGDYIARYQREVLTLKNIAVAQSLSNSNIWIKAWSDFNLGLCPKAWATFNARPLQPWHSRWIRLKAEYLALTTPLRRAPRPKIVRLIAPPDSTEKYAFVCSTRRLAIAPEVKVNDVILRKALTAPGTVFLATTIHDHPRFVTRLGYPVRVFADGLLPSNYPRSYIDSYGDVTFIPIDPISERWFLTCGVTCARPPAFLTSQRFVFPISPASGRRVLILLNHTGDWCALVNRSDTDVLAEAFIELAAIHPDIDFRIRPHPSMDHPQHEGAGARKRIEAEVNRANLANLRCSQGKLEDDLRTSDLAISEYSATLVDAWQRGLPGLIVNLTNRRSFMQDYEELGYVAIHTRENLNQFFAHLDQSVCDLVKRQTCAVQCYNTMLANFIAS